MITPTVLVESKPFWKSKTVLFNVLAGLVVLLTQASTLGMPESVTKWIATAIVVINVVLRFVSNQPVTLAAAAKAIEVPAAPRGMPT